MKIICKKVLCLCLILVMLVSMMPLGVLAEDNANEIGDYNLTSNISEDLAADGEALSPDLPQNEPLETTGLSVDEPQISTDEKAIQRMSGSMETMAMASGFTYFLTNQGAVITDYEYTDGAGKAVKIPERLGGKKVVGIGDNAFSGMNITSIDFSGNNNNLQFIGSGAFYDCDDLVTVELPSSITMINNVDPSITYVGSFENCEKLATIEIPQAVTDMGVDVFKDSALVKIIGVTKSYAEDYATEYGIPFFEVKLPVVTNLEIDKASGQNIGTTIKLTATAAGGTAPYKYKFYYELADQPEIIANFQNPNFVNFPLSKPGSYTFYVVVQDANNKTYTKAYPDYTVINEAVVTLEADKPSSQYINTDITLTATVADKTGTAPFVYNFYYKLGEEIEVIEENSGDNQANFRPSEGGSYTLFVEVEDAEGLVRTAEIKDYLIVDDLSVGNFTVTPTKEDPKRPEINTVVKLEAQGAGGKTGYQYRFYYEVAEKTVVIQGYSSKNTAEFSPTTAGSYTLYVDVKNGSGKVSTQMIEAYTVVDTPVINSLVTDLPSGQSVKTPITLTADVSGGTEPYQYQFFYQLGSGSKTPIDGDETKKEITFTPEAKGTYKFYVEVKDDNPNSSVVTKMIANYKVIPELVGKSLTANKASGQNINTIIKLTAAGSGGKTPYEYEFSYQLGASDPVVFRDYSRTRTADFVPQEAGDYILTVKIKDANGRIAVEPEQPEPPKPQKPLTMSLSYKVANNPVVTAFKTNLPSGQYVDTEIGLVAESSGGTGDKSYTFTAKNGSKDVPSTDFTQTVAGSDTAIFTPTEPGTYVLTVTVTDTASGKATKTITNYKVLPGVSVTSFSARTSKDTNIGDKIPLTASARGGKSPYEYRFYYKLDGGVDEVVIRDYSKIKTAEFVPTVPGDHQLFVQVRDVNGIKSPEEELGSGAIEVANNPMITSFSCSKPSGQYVGEDITLTAAVAGGTGPYTYAFSYKLGSAGTPVEIEKHIVPDQNATTTFSIPTAGTYTLYVEVEDFSATKKVTQSIIKYNVMAKPVASSLKANKVSPLNLANSLRLTATATGGKAPYEYEFSYQFGADSAAAAAATPVVFKDFSKAKTADFIKTLPAEAGTYQFSVKIKDANGVISDPKILDSGDFIIANDPVITSFKAGLPSGQYVDTAIPLTVETTGGTAVTYHYYFKLGSAVADDIKAASPDQTAIFTPTEVGIYTIYVEAKDGVSGNSVTKTITSYKVIADLSGTLTISETIANVDDTIKLTATAAGGKSPYRYKFYFKKDGGAEELIRNYSTTRTTNFKPQAAGNYTVYVEITDNDKNTPPDIKSADIVVSP